jgi:hypothetical protein
MRLLDASIGKSFGINGIAHSESATSVPTACPRVPNPAAVRPRLASPTGFETLLTGSGADAEVLDGCWSSLVAQAPEDPAVLLGGAAPALGLSAC